MRGFLTHIMSYDHWLLSLSLCWRLKNKLDRALASSPEEVCMQHKHPLTLLSKWRHTTDFCCLYQTNHDSRLTQPPQRNFQPVRIQKPLCTLFKNHLATSPKGRFATFSSCLRTILSPNSNKHTCGSSKTTRLILQIPNHVSPAPNSPSHLWVGVMRVHTFTNTL